MSKHGLQDSASLENLPLKRSRQDLLTIAEHKELDDNLPRMIVNSSAEELNDAMHILSAIVCGWSTLDHRYRDPHECRRLLEDNPDIHHMLKEAQASGSYKEIRILGKLFVTQSRQIR
jgi:hypothetical protein